MKTQGKTHISLTWRLLRENPYIADVAVIEGKPRGDPHIADVAVIEYGINE